MPMASIYLLVTEQELESKLFVLPEGKDQFVHSFVLEDSSQITAFTSFYTLSGRAIIGNKTTPLKVEK
jgi:hypothetical protein